MLADRLSLLSCNCGKVARAISEYEEATRRSGHSCELRYVSPPGSHKRKSRKRNIVSLNSPISEHVNTNIGKVFLHLLTKHFSPHHRLHKICNKNYIKVSYSCMLNMAVIHPGTTKRFLLTEPSLPTLCHRVTARLSQLPDEGIVPRKLLHL